MVTEYPHYIASLQDSVRRFWDKKALNDVGGESYSFGEMAVRIEKLSLFMAAAGIRPKEDKVAICAHNCARWGMVFLGINTYGAVAVPILFDFTPDSVCNLVDHSDSVGLFTTGAKWAKMDVKAMPKLRFAVNIEKWELLFAADDKLPMPPNIRRASVPTTSIMPPTIWTNSQSSTIPQVLPAIRRV